MTLHRWSRQTDEHTRKARQLHGSAPVIIQHKDGSIAQPARQPEDSFYTEIPDGEPERLSTVINRLIAFALDTLNAHHVELRVVAPCCEE